MELGFLAIVVASTGLGLLCGTRVSPTIGRLVLTAGVLALALGLVILGLTLAGWGPLGMWAAGLASVFLFAMAAVMLPFALAASFGRR